MKREGFNNNHTTCILLESGSSNRSNFGNENISKSIKFGEGKKRIRLSSTVGMQRKVSIKKASGTRELW